MTEKGMLIDLIVTAENEVFRSFSYIDSMTRIRAVADYLIENGVIVPPVKVGDTVYVKGEAVEISYIHIEKEVCYCIQLDCGERDCCICPFYEDSVSWEGEHDCRQYGYIEFTANDIGKTVFLTREEAEKALVEEKEREKMNRQVQVGSVYRHFKGFKATIITVANHTETGEQLVVYECDGSAVNSEHVNGIYARPIEMFLSEVDHEKYPNVKQKYRFELIKEREDNV